MEPNKLPQIVIKQIEKISPSGYFALESCTLQGILEENNDPLIPSSPNAHVGTIVHMLLQGAILGDVTTKNMQQEWDDACRKTDERLGKNPLEIHLVPLNTSANNFEVKKYLLFKMIEDIEKDRIPHEAAINTVPEATETIPLITKVETEEGFETPDKKVRGRIDLIRHTAQGIEIVDYKTGAIEDQNSNDGSPKSEYAEQLKLYAALFHSERKVWPKRLLLVGLDQKEHNITFTEKECQQILEKAIHDINSINQQIAEGKKPENLATPSPKACHYCKFRPICKAYWSAKGQPKDGWPIDVVGEVKENKILGNGLRRVIISTDRGDLSIRGLSDRHRFLNNNPHKVLFCNLSADIREGFYLENMLTVGYVQE